MVNDKPKRGRPPVPPEVEREIEERLRRNEKPQDIAQSVEGAYLTKVYEVRRRIEREASA